MNLKIHVKFNSKLDIKFNIEVYVRFNSEFNIEFDSKFNVKCPLDVKSSVFFKVNSIDLFSKMFMLF